MESVKANDIDKLLMQIQQALDAIALENEEDNEFQKKLIVFCGNGFTIKIPAEFKRVTREKETYVFFSKNRPETILVHTHEHAGMTFQRAILDEVNLQQDLNLAKEYISQVLKRSDSRIVFYEEGQLLGDVPVIWLDYKSFAGDERIYNILFLFEVGECLTIGTFYCNFENYERWKPQILRMLRLIKQEELIDAGV